MKIKEKFWVGTFISLWLLVSTVSTFHAVEFFELSNNQFLSWVLAFAFELGAMASLGGMVIGKGNKSIIWIMFILLTAFQIHGNMFYAWTHSGDLTNWTNLFDLGDEDVNFTKRVFSFISGGILPLISLGFVKSLMDYLKPQEDVISEGITEEVIEGIPDEKNNKQSSFTKEEIENNEKLRHEEISEIEFEEVKDDVKIDNTTGKVNISDEPLEMKKEFWLGQTDESPIIEEVKDSELNTKSDPINLGDIIDKAENTVNSIGEK